MLGQPSTGIDRCARRIIRRSLSAIARTSSSPTPATAASAPRLLGRWAAAGTIRRAGALGAAAGDAAGAAACVKEPVSVVLAVDVWLSDPVAGVDRVGAPGRAGGAVKLKLWKKWVAAMSDVVAWAPPNSTENWPAPVMEPTRMSVTVIGEPALQLAWNMAS